MRDDVPEAMHNLGMCFLFGEGVARNLSAAAVWFEKVCVSLCVSVYLCVSLCIVTTTSGLKRSLDSHSYFLSLITTRSLAHYYSCCKVL